MADIIVQWLGDRIGYIIEVNSYRFVEAMKSGILLAHIFQSYGLFSDEQVEEVINGNMNILEVFKAYLKNMDIVYNDEIHEKITSGNITAAMQLLYQLYLCLQSKDKLQHIAVAERKKIMMTGTERFSVTPVCEDAKFVPQQDVHPFSQPLRSLKHIVRWHKEKHQSFVDRCKKDRQQYILQLNAQVHDKNISRKGIPSLHRKTFVANVEDDFDNSSVDLSYDQLVSSQKKYEDVSITLPNPEEAEKLLNKLTMRMQKKRASDATGVKLKRAMLNQLWDRILKQQLETFENSVIDETLKQSIFEKQMVRKAFDIRQQKDSVFQNRQHLDVEIKRAAEDNFCLDLFHSEALNEEKENLYYLEKNRAYELHRRLYAERQHLILEKTTEMCRSIVNDFADMAMYTAEYKMNYQVECSSMQKIYLSTLFRHEKQIFDNILPIEDILNYDPEDCSEELEEIYALELSRHYTIMDSLFNDYAEMNWPWQINLADKFSPEELDLWHLGINVMGHIVHRVLLAKYPKPVPPPPPDLPAVPIAVCLNGLTNLAIINPLKEILREKQIEVIEMQDAINYCLEVFNEETTIEYTDTLFEQEERAVQELAQKVSLKLDAKHMTIAKNHIKNLKTKPLKKSTKTLSQNQSGDTVASKEGISPKIAFPPFGNKSAQTPKLFPWEQIVHSAAGELGRVAYNILNVGEPLQTYLTVKMLVQYLISLKSKNIGGWVLVNFPNTISDATHLEEELSNLPVPCPPAMSEADLNDYVKIADKLEVPENQPVEEINAMKRRSNILPNPSADNTSQYKTTLTAFIALTQITEEEQLHFEQFIIETPTDPLQAFYYKQGCKYDLWFKLWDFRTLKILAKLIIGNFSLPRQNSVEMLGPSVEYLEAMLDIPTGIDVPPLVRQKKKKDAAKGKAAKAAKAAKVSASTTNVEDKKTKKTSTKTTANVNNQQKKGKKGTGKSPTASNKFDADGDDTKLQLPLVYHKETQIPEVEQVEDIIEVDVDEPKEANWQYVMCSIPEDFQCILATLWENVEEVFVNDLKKLFFRRRILLDSIIPYIAFIKTHMQRFITRPDMKQKQLHDFQLLHNQLDEDMRDDEELKAEIHCRIFEFKNALYDICDERMKENEGERQRLIEDNWTIKSIIQIINVKTTMMQIELDAFVDTLRLVTEYYYGMVTKSPVGHIELNKLRLNKIVYDEETTPDNLIVKLISYMDQLLKSKDPIPNTRSSPFEDVILNTHEKAKEFASQTHQYIVQYVSNLAALFKPKDANKKETKPKPVSTKKSKMDPKKMPTSLILDADVIECSNNLMEEFKSAVEAAYIVIQMRLDINLLACTKLFHSILRRNKDAFLFIYHAIEQRYEREVNSVELACSILSRAVEAECKIQPQLILAGDEFLVEPDVLLFEDGLPIHDDGLQQAESQYIYSIQQLQETLDLFKLYAPNCFLPERVFTYILQDIVVHNLEDGSPWLIPALWRQLQPQQVSMLTKDLFGNTEYIDWREYILFNLMMRFPKIHEILAMRYFFREMDPDDTELVYEYQYQTVSLWFEKPEYNLDYESDSAAALRHKHIKTLLWHCYKIDEQRINYTALLLAICKDRFPANGIAKALSLSLGKEVCGNYKLGEMYLNTELDKRQRLVWQEAARQIEHEDNIKVAEEVLEQMTESVLDECDSERLVLKEIRSTANDVQAAATATLEHGDDDDSQQSHGPKEVFSNVEIGFEAFDFPNWVYTLQFDDLMNVFATALPCIFSKQSVGDDKSLRENITVLYESLRIPDLDNNVYVHRFLHSPELVQLMTDISKFSTRYPVNTVFEMLKNE